MLEKVHRIQDAGMEVWCGMILGFDHDDPSIFEAQRQFVQDSRIINAIVNMLVAIPRLHFTSGSPPKAGWTPRATRRIRAFGTNVLPLRSAEASCDPDMSR